MKYTVFQHNARWFVRNEDEKELQPAADLDQALEFLTKMLKFQLKEAGNASIKVEIVPATSG